MLIIFEKFIFLIKLLFLFLLITLIIAYNNDQIQRQNVESSLSTFCDIVRERGFVSKGYYEQIMSDVSKYNYEIRLVHKRSFIDSSYREVEDISTNEVILQTLYNKAVPEQQRLYRMKKGDQFKIIASPVQPSFFRKLLGLGNEAGFIKSGMIYYTPDI